MTRFACRDLSNHAATEASWGSQDAHVQSTATRRPWPQAVRARGAPRLPFRFVAKPSPSMLWARGLLSAFGERGSPDLPACGLWRGSKGGPNAAHLHQQAFETLARDNASRGGRHKTSSGAASPGWLARGREFKSRRTLRGSSDVSHDDQGQAGASGRRVLVSSLVLKE